MKKLILFVALLTIITAIVFAALYGETRTLCELVTFYPMNEESDEGTKEINFDITVTYGLFGVKAFSGTITTDGIEYGVSAFGADGCGRYIISTLKDNQIGVVIITNKELSELTYPHGDTLYAAKTALSEGD